jgi:hypothetical protein
MVHQLVQLAAPWQRAYGNSTLLSVSVTALHVLSLLFGGGLAIAADRSTLRLWRQPAGARSGLLRELHDVHRPVLAACAVLFASGVLLAAADLETFLASPAFWIKLALVAALVLNGALLMRTERALRAAAEGDPALPRLWARLRWRSWCSLALWGTTALVGVVLVNA